jgi:hypothetical protein
MIDFLDLKPTTSARNGHTQKLKKKKELDVEKKYNNRKIFYSNSIL